MKLLGKLRPKNGGALTLIASKDTLVLPKLVGSIAIGAQEAQRLSIMESGSERCLIVAYPASKNSSGLRSYATLIRVLQVLKMPDNSLRLVAEGLERVKLGSLNLKESAAQAAFDFIKENSQMQRIVENLSGMLKENFNALSKAAKLEQESANIVLKSKNTDELFSRILINIPHLDFEKKLDIYCLDNAQERFEALIGEVQNSIEGIELRKNVSARVKKRIERNQREFFLQEQLREINRELGENGTGDPGSVKELEERLNALSLSDEAKETASRELNRLSRLQPSSPESTMLRNYLEWIADLPWNNSKPDAIGLSEAQKILDDGHYGMEKPKERILDYIAVRKISGGSKSPILCFAGPPGVGKTSLAKSIAQALGRDFVRVSLGGVRDETEIKGHRRSYVGALPGKIIQSMKKAKSSNPVFLLDEIDKMASDHKGDPAGALLEVLDPEQNASFADTYMEIGYDLSQALFIATANDLNAIPYPLLDRMEIVELSGYTETEKKEILRKFLLPKQLKENGLENSQLLLDDEAALALTRLYTNESGVRQLERETNRLVRKLVRKKLQEGALEQSPGQSIQESISAEQVKELLGKTKYNGEDIVPPMQIGMALGLAWTATGGRVLPIEAKLMKGDGKLLLTGKLGDVMKESAQIALSFLRGYAEKAGMDPNFQKSKDIHIHVPEGATPKDGPSAGIAIAAALFSAVSGKRPRKKTAMTGEITLSGQLLPIGGLKEKTLAAYRSSINTIAISSRNERDLDEIPKEALDTVEFKSFATAGEALDFLFNP